MIELVKVSLAEQIYNKLRQDIILQTIPCGQKLTIRDLQEVFNVSSTPVREALTRLSQEGFVEFNINQGAKVIELTLKDMIEIHDICALHDSYAVRLAMASEKRESLICDLNRVLDEQKSNFYESKEYYLNNFHEMFYNYISNNRFKNMHNQIKGLFSIVVIKSTGNNYQKESYEEHLQVFEEVCLGNVERAVDKMFYHLENGKKRLINHIT